MNTNFSSNMSLVTMVGYRFHPTDQELIIKYLQPKLQDGNSQNPIMDVVDIYKVEPWDLPALAKMKSKDPVWYFFCRREKYKRSERSSRTTIKGYWKPTGKPRPINAKARCTKKVIGQKKTLVYYFGRPKGTSTKWIIHEYTTDSSVAKQEQGEFVLCKLKKKSDEKHKKNKINHHNIALTSNYGNQESNEMNSMNSMPSHDIGKSNQVMSLHSINESILETTTTSDLACDGSGMSFHVTDLSDSLSPSGMATNTTQEVGVSNLENPNLDNIALNFDYENLELDEMNFMIPMPFHDIGEPNQFMSVESTKQNILETTTTSDLACDGSGMSFHVTDLSDTLSPSGMATNTTQEVGVSNLKNPNLDNIALNFDYENLELDEMNFMIPMPFHDIGEPNKFMSVESTKQNILETTTTSDLACDGSGMSFHVTSLIDILSPSGMATNTIQEVGVSNLENPNLDKQDSISASTRIDGSMFPATSSTNFGILDQQEKGDDVSSVDGLLASDFLNDIEDIYEKHLVWALMASMLEQEDMGNFDPQMPTCFEESTSLQ